MSNLFCKIFGHKWQYNGNFTNCKRCGKVCNHEGLDFSRVCKLKCDVCGNENVVSHNNVTSDDGIVKCTKCGDSEINWTIRNDYLKKREEKARLEQEDKILKNAMVGDDQFRCEVCRKNKPIKEMTDQYHRPICCYCVSNKLRKYAEHLVYDKCDGYEKKVICVKCGRDEFWRDAEHQGPLLSEYKCI